MYIFSWTHGNKTKPKKEKKKYNCTNKLLSFHKCFIDDDVKRFPIYWFSILVNLFLCGLHIQTTTKKKNE